VLAYLKSAAKGAGSQDEPPRPGYLHAQPGLARQSYTASSFRRERLLHCRCRGCGKRQRRLGGNHGSSLPIAAASPFRPPPASAPMPALFAPRVRQSAPQRRASANLCGIALGMAFSFAKWERVEIGIIFPLTLNRGQTQRKLPGACSRPLDFADVTLPGRCAPLWPESCR